MVEWYIEGRRPDERRELKFYREQPSLEAAIEDAALAVRSDGTRHPHQSRRRLATLRTAHKRLRLADLGACRTFDQLHAAIEQAIGDVWDIGPLTIYDAALRIGAFLGLEPEVVYLHRGTRDGARALGLEHRRRSLRASELPPAFRRLRPYEIEDCLCIYKSELAAIAG